MTKFPTETPQGKTPLEIIADFQKNDIRKGNPKMTPAERMDLLDAVNALQIAENLSNASMAKILRCSSSAWSQIRRKIYKGDIDKYLNNARQWITDRKDRTETPITEYVPTQIGKRIIAVCRRAWAMPTIGRIVTPAGAGKTSAMVEFARLRGDRAVYLSAGQAYCTQTGLMMELTRLLHIPVTTRSSAAMMYSLARDRLADYYAGGKADPFCLLIDEATTLRPAALNLLRNLHDDPVCRVAVVLADTWRLDAELRSRKGFAGGYEQLRSRFGATYSLKDSTEIAIDDVKQVAKSILDTLGFNRAINQTSVKFLHRLAQMPGKLRNVVQRLHAVHDVAESCKTRATYSVAELDYVATLVGAECEMNHGKKQPFTVTAA